MIHNSRLSHPFTHTTSLSFYKTTAANTTRALPPPKKTRATTNAITTTTTTTTIKMGCTASKLDNEDTVRRCKERRRFMKAAVQARHNLASAHSDYLRSLRFTGAALSDFAKGEPFSVSDQTPSVFLRNPSSIPQKSLPPPPPSLPSPPPPPLKKRPIYSHSSSPTSATPKLPHILSQSSISSKKPPPSYTTNSHYSATPSQTSSVWNWENFYPPSPPDSEFFNRFENNPDTQNPDTHNQNHHHHLDDDDEEEEEEEEEGTEREEVHCSEWGDDHYSTTSSSDTKSDNGDVEGERSETGGTRWNYGGGSSIHDDTSTSVSNYPPMGGKSEAGSSVSWNAGNGEISDMRMVVRHQDLVEIVDSIKEYFDKAAAAGETVSDLLEITRAQIDRSIGQLKKTVYHSNSVLSSLSSSLTSKPPLSVKYRLDPGSLDEPGGSKSLCSTLERLWAWEKKLYEEVKAREGVKIEHEKKLSSLQSQEHKGDQAKLDKTKASIQRLQSLITVTSQAVSTTSSAITCVRDTELAPQLIELCHGLMYMWRSMNQLHEVQNDIVQQVRGLVNRATKGATTELHRQATCHLESAVSSWHSSFCRLIKYQRDYVHSLHSWLKLTLFHVGNENTINTNEYHTHLDSVQISSGLVTFSDEWKQALDRLPDTVAAEAIKSFINVVHVISMKQSEELKMKKKTETVSKELEKKSSSLRNLEKKFYQSYSMVGIGMPGGGSDGGGEVYDSRDPLSEKRLELKACQRRVEDEMSRHAKSIEITRAMTLNNIQTGLPGVFQAMTGFSSVFTEALEGVCTRSYSIK